METTKRCPLCNLKKSMEDFTNDKNRKDGKYPYCKACRKKGFEANRDKVLADMKAHRRTNIAATLLVKARKRAKAAEVPCTIEVEDIEVPTHCPVLGIPLAVQDGRFGPNSPTLDRLDATLGYIPGNIAVISFRANLLKSNGSREELEKVAAWLRQPHG